MLIEILFFYWLTLSRDTFVHPYNFQLDVGTKDLCPDPNSFCSGGKRHFLCERPRPCADHKQINLTESMRNMFTNTHNGIRNKIAGYWNIANMNLVHWSRELEIMAQIYLYTCSYEVDPCLRIGTRRLRVGQNQITSKLLIGRWPGYSVRTWYLELGYTVQTFEDYVKVLERGKNRNFTHMVWPNLQFIGCSAAYFKGTNHIICYYYPSHKQSTRDVFKFGAPCSGCPETRHICSLTFAGLCGIDIDVTEGRACSPTSPSYILLNLFCITLFALNNKQVN